MRGICLLAISVLPALATTYDYVPFAGPGGAQIQPTAINDSGQIVGAYTDSAGVSHGFLRAPNGTLTTIDVPGSAATTIAGINSSGWIAGSYATVCCQMNRGFLLSPDLKTFTTLTIGTDRTIVTAINDNGQATGYTEFGNRGFIAGVGQSPVTFQQGSYSTYATSINNRGDVVGYGDDGRHTEAFRRITDGTIAQIGLGDGSTATGINDSYEIVGSYPMPSKGPVAYVRDAYGNTTILQGLSAAAINNNGQVIGNLGPYGLYNPDGSYVVVSLPGATGSSPIAINSSGVIAGTYYLGLPNGASQTFGYVATPMTTTAGPLIRAYHGVTGASGFGGSLASAPGSWIEIYGVNLAGTTRTWATTDFTGNIAPTTLDGVSVSVNGAAAYVAYVSPIQINAFLPASLPAGQANVTVTYKGATTPPQPITLNPTQPGLLTVNGCLAPVFANGVLASISCIGHPTPPQAAHPGDTLVFYGVGFGPVTPATPDGQIVAQTNQLVAAFGVNWSNLGATTPGQVTYAGLSPGSLGVYQFNVTVPPVSNLSPSAASGIIGAWTFNGVTLGTWELLVRPN